MGKKEKGNMVGDQTMKRMWFTMGWADWEETEGCEWKDAGLLLDSEFFKHFSILMNCQENLFYHMLKRFLSTFQFISTAILSIVNEREKVNIFTNFSFHFQKEIRIRLKHSWRLSADRKMAVLFLSFFILRKPLFWFSVFECYSNFLSIFYRFN